MIFTIIKHSTVVGPGYCWPLLKHKAQSCLVSKHVGILTVRSLLLPDGLIKFSQAWNSCDATGETFLTESASWRDICKLLKLLPGLNNRRQRAHYKSLVAEATRTYAWLPHLGMTSICPTQFNIYVTY